MAKETYEYFHKNCGKLNIIFGPNGTGKSKLLKDLQQKYIHKYEYYDLQDEKMRNLPPIFPSPNYVDTIYNTGKFLATYYYNLHAYFPKNLQNLVLNARMYFPNFKDLVFTYISNCRKEPYLHFDQDDSIHWEKAPKGFLQILGILALLCPRYGNERHLLIIEPERSLYSRHLNIMAKWFTNYAKKNL